MSTATSTDTTSLPRLGRSAAHSAPGPRRRPSALRSTGHGHARVVGLDGLRAVAVVAVIAYHLDPRWLPGGFLGVDVFFVVSGFIITTMLLRELRRRRRISLPAFWARRARRLLPALAAVVVTSVVAARVVQPDLLVGIGRQVLGAATFSSNWVEIAAGGSYFDSTAPVLFQTFWSLAVEEQFYLVWPVLLVLLLVLVPSVRVRVWLALAGGAASAILMAVLYDPSVDPTRVYYGTDTHAFGLLLGAAAALHGSTGARLLPRTVSRWAAPVAAGGLVALMGTLHDDSPWAFRGGILLGSVLALVLVARCADVTGQAPRTLGIRVLEALPVVWVGVRSYGLYLWHWPVILVVGGAVGAQPGTTAWWRGTVAAVVLTTALAAASYRWIETPVRREGFRGTVARVRGSVDPGARRPVLARTVLGVRP